MADNRAEYLGQTVELLRVVTTVLRKVCRAAADLASQPCFSFTLSLSLLPLELKLKKYDWLTRLTCCTHISVQPCLQI